MPESVHQNVKNFVDSIKMKDNQTKDQISGGGGNSNRNSLDRKLSEFM